MEIKAKVKNIKMSPRKVRLVVDLVRGLKVSNAVDQLMFLNKKAAKPTRKLIESCLANAIHNYELDKNNLYIKEIRVDDGPTMKRWKPRAFGRASAIRKRTSQINVILAELKDSGEKKAKVHEIDAPISLDQLSEQQKSTKEDKK